LVASSGFDRSQTCCHQEYRRLRTRFDSDSKYREGSGKKFWVKYHFKAEQGIQNFTDAEARAMFAEDLDYHRRDLWDAR
jgi:catalase